MGIWERLGLDRPVSIAPLVFFRICFGLLMFVSMLRFEWRGWVESVYIKPRYHFTYMGFEWVGPLGGVGMHVLFLVLALAALLITLGFLYRMAMVVFFLGFTYVELIDVTTYLNHYYFISLVAFLLIWLPANRAYSLDVLWRPELRSPTAPLWTIGIIRFQVGAVYVFAGLAKLNIDWLIHAEPMKTWLPAKSHLPVVGQLLYKEWVAYVFSWFGTAYDLFIVFFLLWGRTRAAAYVFVLVFHVATAVFFPGIGLFPYVMMLSSLIFFPGEVHERLLPFYKRVGLVTYPRRRVVPVLVGLYVLVQVLVPMRYLLYPGRLFWHEQGYRFSWRVMLMEKSGAAYFTVKDESGEKSFVVDNKEFLTPVQEKMMSTQPDMILRYAHYLAGRFEERGWAEPRVYGEVYVALNGRRSRLFIDSTVNLAAEKLSWRHYDWVLPFNDEK
ncbi:MAG: HTTM domain-containing protein [Bacteroidetes bacterium]|nr:HTTM domain-containing protein [Bacteroidota bacterium]